MADFITSTGIEITFDLNKITRKEYKGIFDPKEKDDKSDATLAKAGGLTAKQLDDMSAQDFKAFFAAFLKKCREPLAVPNSQGASTSE